MRGRSASKSSFYSVLPSSSALSGANSVLQFALPHMFDGTRQWSGQAQVDRVQRRHLARCVVAGVQSLEREVPGYLGYDDGSNLGGSMTGQHLPAC